MMDVTMVLKCVFVVCLSGPTFGFPFTRSGNLFGGPDAGPRGGPEGPQLSAHLEDYLANYVQGRGQFPQYQPAAAAGYQQPGYIAQLPQQPKLSAETLAALLPYLSSSGSSSLNNGVGSGAMTSSDYVYPDYPMAAAAPPAYSDEDGTWYDDMASQAQAFNNEPSVHQEEEQAVLQLLLDHLNGRYSLDDLEAMEREAEMEENTESQLQSLMNKKMVKKSGLGPTLGVRNGQKEEAPLMPATSIRRPVWGQQQHQGHMQGTSSLASKMNVETKRSIEDQGTLAANAAQVNINNKVSDSISSSSSTPASASSSSSTVSTSTYDDSNSGHSSADSLTQEGTTMTPRLQTAYDALKNYLDRERKFRQEQDDLAEMAELTEPSRGGIQKRFAPADEDALSQQLVNLKKNRT